MKIKRVWMLALLFHLISCDNRSIELEGIIEEPSDFDIQVYANNLTIPMDSTVIIYVTLQPPTAVYKMSYTNTSLGILQDSTGQIITAPIDIVGDARFYYQPQLQGTQELTFTFSKAENTSQSKQLTFTVIP